MMRRWWLLLLIPLILGLGFVFWALSGPDAMPEAEAALTSDTAVEVVDVRWLVFSPTDVEPTSGLIIYPGGRVDPAAYAPLAKAAAAVGYLTVIVPMPLNLAVLSSEKALQVIDEYPEISTWVIAGHSLGGAMAANLVGRHPDLFDGLALWAAYPGQSDDLSSLNLKVTSIYGKNDGVASVEEIQASGPLLPPDTRWVAIEGGNHSQFGWYGLQSGDNPAQISREEQQEQILLGTLALMETLSAGQ